MTYTIPLIPPSENKYKGRENHWQYRKDKQEWESLIALLCKPKPKEPIAKSKLTLTYYFPTKIRHDPNNYSGQFITDGLVKAGIIQDDSFECIQLVLQGGYDKQKPRTEIEVIEL